MDRYTLSCSAEAHDLEPVVLAVHELIHRLPVTAKSRDRDGIRVEDGRIIDRHYNGPILIEAIATNKQIQVTPSVGPYKGVPVRVTPFHDADGNAIGAIGIVDITGIFDLATLMEHQADIIKQVCGKDPCPLDSEQINSRR